MTTATLAFDNSFARDLPEAGVRWNPAVPPAPRLLYLNRALAQSLGLDADDLSDADGAGAALFSGQQLPEGAEPVAQAYAGHQFGGFSPQLGDGRAVLLGEVIDSTGQRRDIAFKGSGRTPFSRGGDGKAAVGPMLREVLIGEAMHALGIPSTRALAVAATGEAIYRETPLPGAVLTRVAASHLRVGSFQFFAARGEFDALRRLRDYAIARHDPALAALPEAERWCALLEAVARRQARLIAQWMNVGFIHGVMNTDNMTISGETIDYGPCAFMEAYDPKTVFSSIDHGGRYAYGNQPQVARWNLAKLAEALLPLAPDVQQDGNDAALKAAVDRANAVIDAFPGWYAEALLAGQRAKLGLTDATPADDAGDRSLAEAWLALLQNHQVDFTLGWRHLADAAAGDETPLRRMFDDTRGLVAWLGQWRTRCGAAQEGLAARLREANPLVIPRNHQVEEALAAASADPADLGPFRRLLDAVQHPFSTAPEHAPYAVPAPPALSAGYRTFCGT
ncbi:MAG: YdiU family protein [Rhodoferax sp.]